MMRDIKQQEFTNDFSKEIWKTNSKYKDEQSWSDTCKRVATSVANVEKTKKKRLLYKELFYDMMYNKYFAPGGRILANVGVEERKNATLFNCYVYHPSDYNPKDIDSLDNIFESLQQSAKILGREGGLGINLSYLRPEGMYIKGIGNRTPGPIKFAELWDKTSDVITAGTEKTIGNKEDAEKLKIRKGAMMLVMEDWNEAVLEFIEAKQTSNRFTKFNFSVGVSDDLIEAVEKDLMWQFIFPDTKFEKYSDEWNGNIREWKEKGYPVIVTSEIKAKDLWDKIMVSTYTRNEPGVLFLDNANKLSPINYCNHLKATNPCVVGDTLVLTNLGWVKIKNLNKYKKLYSDLKIITSDKNNTLAMSELEWCGITKKDEILYKVSFSNREYILVNEEHKLYDINFNELKIKELYHNHDNIKVIGGVGVLDIIDIEKLDYKEDVYDLTANPNYNFFSVLNREEIIDSQHIIINNIIKLYKFDLVKVNNETKFAYEIKQGDDLHND